MISHLSCLLYSVICLICLYKNTPKQFFVRGGEIPLVSLSHCHRISNATRDFTCNMGFQIQGLINHIHGISQVALELPCPR